MDKNEVMTTEEWERKRKEEEAAKIAPYKAASDQRKENAEIIAEHDELLADMLFEMTMNEIEEE